MFFAQVTAHVAETQTSDYDAPVHYAGWAACLFFTLAVAGAVKYLLAKDKPIKQPFVVSSHPTYADKIATENRFKEVESKIEDARKENKTEMEKLRTEAVDGRRGLHKDIERNADRVADKFDKFAIEITNSVGELRGQIREMGK